MGGNVLFILYLFLIEVLFLARPRLVGWLVGTVPGVSGGQRDRDRCHRF